MRILSSDVQQVFKAYAKQLRSDYAKAKPEQQIRETRAKGFEKVVISEEAKALAANMPDVIQQQAPSTKQDKLSEKRTNSSDETEKNEKESDTTKAESGDSRTTKTEN